MRLQRMRRSMDPHAVRIIRLLHYPSKRYIQSRASARTDPPMTGGARETRAQVRFGEISGRTTRFAAPDAARSNGSGNSQHAQRWRGAPRARAVSHHLPPALQLFFRTPVFLNRSVAMPYPGRFTALQHRVMMPQLLLCCVMRFNQPCRVQKEKMS